MKNGVCPKCSGEEIYHIPGSWYASEEIALGDGMVSKSAIPGKYVCATCGYLEYYLEDESSMRTVRKNWTRVSPRWVFPTRPPRGWK
jgi:hypothetical protein